MEEASAEKAEESTVQEKATDASNEAAPGDGALSEDAPKDNQEGAEQPSEDTPTAELAGEDVSGAQEAELPPVDPTADTEEV